MFNIKSLLLAVIVLLMVFMALEYKKTYEAITIENDRVYAVEHPLSTKAAREAAYGPSNEDTPNFFKRIYANLSGKIDPNMSYMIATVYDAKSTKKTCRTQSNMPKSERFQYFPKIEGQEHKIEIPLNVFNPHKKCKFQLELVRIYFFDRDNEKSRVSSSLLFVNDSRYFSSQRYQKRMLSSDNKIDIECIYPSPFSTESYGPCLAKPLKQYRNIAQYIPTSNINYKLNIEKISLETLSQEELSKIR